KSRRTRAISRPSPFSKPDSVRVRIRLRDSNHAGTRVFCFLPSLKNPFSRPLPRCGSARPGLPMISADEALKLVLDNVTPLGIERTPILDALGRVLAEDIRSPRDIPGFDNSAMDGYAVRAADIARAGASNPIRLRVLNTVAAGAMPTERVEA